MLLLTFFVLYISYFFSFTSAQPYLTDFVFFTTLLPCFFVFSVNHSLLLYICYEVSLLPILYIIIKWGSYSERSVSALMLLVYTSVFSFPLIVGLFYIYRSSNTFSLFVLLPSLQTPLFLSLLILFSFLCEASCLWSSFLASYGSCRGSNFWLYNFSWYST